MIAIVGMGFRFPGRVNEPDRLWRVLAEGGDLVDEMSPARAALFPSTSGDNRPPVGGFLEEVDRFDNAFFNINGLEARYMDPQQRLLLEVVWEALEDGGLRAADLAGRRVGVFAGAHAHDYQELCQRAGAEVNAYWNSGLNGALLANRISYFHDFHGPSLTINTACSSGLEAMHWAVAALQSGQCEQAIAAGVNLILTPTIAASAGRAGMLSPSGRCRAFDAAADGFVRGEGAAALALKPLEKAMADGDRIHAVIRGVATGHGGHANSLTAPNLIQQRELLARAYAQAGVDSASIGYVEAHGTGTKLGDSVELEALREAFGASPRTTARCGLGSIKTNFGHLESAAGLAGVIKVCLAMQRRALPPTVHFRRLNPLIDLSGSPFFVVSEAQPWHAPRDRDGRPLPRRAGVSSFGFGGALAHAVLEEPPPAAETPTSRATPTLWTLSALNPERLRAYAARLRDFLAETGADLSETQLGDVARTFLLGREPMPVRLALLAEDRTQLLEKLTCFIEGRDEEGGAFHLGHGGGKGGFFPSAKRPAPEKAAIEGPIDRDALEALARRWSQGAGIEWRSVLKLPRTRVRAPTYPFAPKRHWI